MRKNQKRETVPETHYTRADLFSMLQNTDERDRLDGAIYAYIKGREPPELSGETARVFAIFKSKIDNGEMPF